MKCSALALSILVAACGGKILDERAGGAVNEGSSATPANGLGGLPPSPASHAEDPCATICESNGGCVGGQKECLERCAEDLRTPSCAAEARAYLGCYADNVQPCLPLPPPCESAYCAYMLCAGKVVPSYCR